MNAGPVKLKWIADRMTNRKKAVAEWLAYSAMALSVVTFALLRPPSIVGDGIDMYGTIWFYWWIDHALTNGLNPGFTDLMFHPLGKDVFGHTGGNFVDALASVPFQRVFGIPFFQPWFIVAVLLGNAVAFRRLLTGLGVRGWARFTATALWMTNPFVMFELLTGRITQAFLWFLPLAIHHFIQIPKARVRDAILVGIFTALQAWTYWFMGWFMALGFAVLALRQIAERSTPVKVLLQGWMVAGVACFVGVSPAVTAMVRRTREGDVPGLGRANGWEGWLDALGGGRLPSVQGWLLTEQSGVVLFGYGLWALLAIWVVFARTTRWRWGAFSVVAMAFAIGPSLTVGGFSDVPVPHYLLGFHFGPFLERLWFPYRWIVMAFLGVCIGGGVLLQKHSWRTSWSAPCVAVLMISASLGAQGREGVFPLKVQDWTVPDFLHEVRHQKGGIIELPMKVPRASLMHQTIHQQPLFGGMGENASVFWPDGFRHRMGNPFIRSLRSAMNPLAYRRPFDAADVDVIRADGMRWVVLDRHALYRVLNTVDGWRKAPDKDTVSAALGILMDILGDPVAVEREFVVWDMDEGAAFPGSIGYTQARLESDEWIGMDWESYVAGLRSPDQP